MKKKKLVSIVPIRHNTNCQKNPGSDSKQRLNILHSSHNKPLLYAFLRMSPISIMLDKGKQIIERKKHGVNHKLINS